MNHNRAMELANEVHGESTNDYGGKTTWHVRDGILEVTYSTNDYDYETAHFRLVQVEQQWVEVQP